MTDSRFRWHSCLPSLSAWLWLLFFLGLSLSTWRLVMINADGDPCLHWRIGNWMIEHRAIIRTDVFSHTRPGAPVVTMEWLSELLFAAAGNLLGWNGIVLLTSALIATCLWILHRQLLSEGVEPLLATALVLLAAMTCSMHWLARPHVVSHLLLALWAWQLRAFHQSRISARALFARLVPLMAVWVNFHAGAFTGLTLIGVYLVGQGAGLLDADDGRRVAVHNMAVLALLGVSCALATLLNPNGWGLHLYIAKFLSHPALVNSVNEFRSPNFHSAGMRGFLLLLLVLFVILVMARSRLNFTEVLLIGWCGYGALHWARNVPVFAIVVTPILAGHLNAFVRDLPETGWVSRYRKVSRDISSLGHPSTARWIVLTAALVPVLMAAKPRLLGGQPVLLTELLANRFPVAATKFLAAHPRAVSGEMFNDYGWGGYLVLAAPDRKVFIDGRNDFYGETLVKEFNEVNEVRPGWEAVFQKFGVGWTILPRSHALNIVLALDPGWRLVYTDEVATIYGRVGKIPASHDLSE